jgi:glutamate/aspartate transport system permease protein
MDYPWHWAVFLEAANARETYLDWLLSGLWTTLRMGVFGWLLAFALGSLLGVMRTLPNRAAAGLASAYVHLLRNVPLIVQLFLWYYLMPKCLPPGWRTWLFAQPPATSALVTATLGLGFFTAARVCEQVRAGIESLPPSTRDAALALGFSLPQAYRHVLLPLCYRLIVPPMTSEMLSIFKNSSIAATIGVIDLFARTRQLNDYTARSYESFIAVIACYFLINAAVMLLMHFLEKRARIPGFIGH